MPVWTNSQPSKTQSFEANEKSLPDWPNELPALFLSALYEKVNLMLATVRRSEPTGAAKTTGFACTVLRFASIATTGLLDGFAAVMVRSGTLIVAKSLAAVMLYVSEATWIVEGVPGRRFAASTAALIVWNGAACEPSPPAAAEAST